MTYSDLTRLSGAHRFRYTHPRPPTDTHTDTHTHAHNHTHPHTQRYMQTPYPDHQPKHAYVYMCRHMRSYVQTHAHMHVIYTYIYIHTHTHTHTCTKTRTHTHTIMHTRAHTLTNYCWLRGWAMNFWVKTKFWVQASLALVRHLVKAGASGRPVHSRKKRILLLKIYIIYYCLFQWHLAQFSEVARQKFEGGTIQLNPYLIHLEPPSRRSMEKPRLHVRLALTRSLSIEVGRAGRSVALSYPGEEQAAASCTC